jgi:hypothetical protein
MGTLENTLKTILSGATSSRTATDGVAGLLAPRSSPTVPPPTAISAPFQRTSPTSTTELAGPPVSASNLSIPQKLQPVLTEIASTATRAALLTAAKGVNIPGASTIGGAVSSAAVKALDGSFSPSAAASLTDVGRPEFAAIAASVAYQTMVPQIHSAARKAGVPPTAVNRIVNAVSGAVQAGIQASTSNAPSVFGTTKLRDSDYIAFTNSTVKEVESAIAASGLNTSQHRQVINDIEINAIRQPPPLVGTALPPAYVEQQSQYSDPQPSLGENSPLLKKVYLKNSTKLEEVVLFKHQPQISVSEVADYSSISPLHMPTGFAVFKGNPTKEYQLADIKLFSRTQEEATENMRTLFLLRGWTKPKFGESVSLFDSLDNEINREQEQSPTVSQKGNGVIGTEDATRQKIEDRYYNDLLEKYREDNKVWGAYTHVDQQTKIRLRAQAVEAARNMSVVPTPETPLIDFSKARNIDVLNIGLTTPNQSRPPSTAITTATTAAGKATAADVRKYEIEQNSKITTGSDLRRINNEIDEKQIEFQKSRDSQTAIIENFDLGTPPPILYFYAYSNDAELMKEGHSQDPDGNIYRIPVVIKSIGYSYPNDVDYIPTESGIPFPALMVISLTLMEIRSPTEVERFSLEQYRAGKLVGW